MEVVQENAAQAQTRQKHCYDQGTSDRTWEVGQQVLVHILPATSNKLNLECGSLQSSSTSYLSGL